MRAPRQVFSVEEFIECAEPDADGSVTARHPDGTVFRWSRDDSGEVAVALYGPRAAEHVAIEGTS